MKRKRTANIKTERAIDHVTKQNMFQGIEDFLATLEKGKYEELGAIWFERLLSEINRKVKISYVQD